MNADASAPSSAGPAPSARKPRFALFLATAGGLGYLPFAPGTCGSFAGLVLALLPLWPAFLVIWAAGGLRSVQGAEYPVFRPTRAEQALLDLIPTGIDPILFVHCLLAIVVALVGVWSAGRAARFWQEKDPQRVVVDEVSGQHLTLVLGLAVPIWWRPSHGVWNDFPLGLITLNSVVSWKYLLLGLILFRVFDIWKPFPVRQAESLPGGWGIMADDWLAAIYAALGLWIARGLGL